MGPPQIEEFAQCVGKTAELVHPGASASQLDSNLDLGYFQEDWNVVFPLGRLRAPTAERVIGSVAATYYSLWAATDPLQMEGYARSSL